MIGLAVLAIIATASVAYFVASPPRGFIFWISTGFICFVEFLAAIIAISTFTETRYGLRPSSATRAIIFGVVVAYAVTGLASILIYSVARGENGDSDGRFLAAIIGISIFWFVIAAILYGYDLFSQSAARPVAEKRFDHGKQARSLNGILFTVRALSISDDALRTRLSIIVKNLEGVELALAHSDGGSSHQGSGISGADSAISDTVLTESIGEIGKMTALLSNGKPESYEAVITDLEGQTANLQSAVLVLNLI